MRPELPIVSFICAVLLSVVLCRQWRSLEVTVLSVFAWLLICNLIHGVNSMINLHFVPIWCDLVTKFELATPFAIASACFCLVRRLEFISSKREMKTSAVWQSRIQTLACLGLPTIYILLSLLVQDHRFYVVQNMGCKAAVFVSAPAIIILWVPILAFCLGTIAYLGIVSARIWRKRADFFLHTTARSRLAGLDFQVLLSMSAVQALLLAYSVISKLALSTVLTWTSLAAVHTDWGQVEFVSTDTMSTRERAELELDWWIVPTLSLVTLVSLAFGASVRIGMRDVAQRVQRHIRRPSANPSFLLPMHTESVYSGRDSLLAPVSPQSIKLQKAVSDESLRTTPAKGQSVPTPADAIAPSPSPPPQAADPDASFMHSTLAYLGSPTARHCGLSLPSCPPSIYVPQDYNSASRPSTGGSSDRDQRRESNGTLASSILAGPWPQPPTDVPFNGPGSGFVPVVRQADRLQPQPLLKPVYRRPSLTGKGRPKEVRRNPGTIYMTVVKESVA